MALVNVDNIGPGPLRDLAEAAAGPGGMINSDTLLWLHDMLLEQQRENEAAEGEAPTDLVATPASAPPATTAPVAKPPATTAPASDPYAAFKDAYRKAFGQDITQAELNYNGTITTKDGKPVYTGLYQLSNDLIKLLPVDRLLGFDAKRLRLMSGRDLLPLFQKYPNTLFDFGTDYLSTNFSSTEIQGFIDSMKKLQPTHPSVTELQNVVNKVQGKPPVTQPPVTQPPVTTPPGTQPPVTTPPGTQPVSSKWQIPQLVSPTAAGKTPLELYLSMIGAKAPAATTTGKARIMGPIDPVTGEPTIGPGVLPELPGEGGGGVVAPTTEEPKVVTDPWAALKAALGGSTTTGKTQAEIDAAIALINQKIAASEAGIEQAKKNYELAKSQNDREAQYQALNYQAAQQNALEQAQSRQAELELQRQQLATQERLGLGELGLKTQAQLGYADLGKDIPTLERELAVSQANLNNFQAQAQAAYQAGNIALAEQAQAQAAKEYDRSQTLTEEIQRGQLGLQTAGVTGAYGGMPTLEAEIRRGQLGLQAADILGAYGGMPTLEAEVQRGQLGLQAGQLTGQYGGMPTLEAQAQAQQFGLAQAGVTGTYGGAPTLQSLRQQADIAYQAAQVAFAQGNFEEGQRQFNISSGLARQAQEFSQGMQTAQMEREVMASPIGLIEQIYRARGGAMPALAGQAEPALGVPQGSTAFLPERPVAATPQGGATPGRARIFGGEPYEAMPLPQRPAAETPMPALAGQAAPIAPQAAAPLPEEGIARFGPPGWTGFGPTGFEPKSERDFLPVEAPSPFLPKRPVAVTPQGGATPGTARIFQTPQAGALASAGGRIPQRPAVPSATPFLPERPVAAMLPGGGTPGTEPYTAMPLPQRPAAQMPALEGEYMPSVAQQARQSSYIGRGEPATTQAVTKPTIATRMEPLTWDEINRSGLQLPGITATMAGREPARYQAGMPMLSTQAEQRLLPSERRVFQAELGAMGVNQEDYYSERNRQARTGTPYRRMPTVRRKQRVGGFV